VGSNPTPSAFWEEPFPAAVLTRQTLRRPFWPSATATRNAPGHGREKCSTAHSCVDEADASDSQQNPLLIICLNPRDISVREARGACPCYRHRLQRNHDVAAAARCLPEHCPTVVIRERLFGARKTGPSAHGPLISPVTVADVPLAELSFGDGTITDCQASGRLRPDARGVGPKAMPLR
jgi:hypothetical protein